MLSIVLLSAVVGGNALSRPLKAKDAGDYYDGIDMSATDLELKTQLHDLINPHTVLSYDDAWDAFADISEAVPGPACDPKNSTLLHDVYSTYCWIPEYTGEGGQCGSYHTEGDCFNREHSWPKSWFGGFDEGANAQTDLFELYPTDGYVNGLRGNLPMGNVDTSKTVSYTSTNGAMIGTCSSKDYSGTCFEIADKHKGDFARTYFYLSTAYMGEWSCCDVEGVDRSSIKPWMEAELKAWHKLDPVDKDEAERNDFIFGEFQHNRNPFIDYPELVDQISDF
jgi:endonuclease I